VYWHRHLRNKVAKMIVIKAISSCQYLGTRILYQLLSTEECRKILANNAV